MISIFQGWLRKYQDLIQLWQDSLYVSTQFSIHHVCCVKQEVYWQVCGRCIYGNVPLWQDFFYVSTHFSIHHVSCVKQEVCWEARRRCVH